MNTGTTSPVIPGFRILRLLGEGAMARVFLALDESLDRKIALKVMNQSLANDPAFRDRFLAEAKDTAKFVHPGIVSIYSTGVHENNYYLVLEYLESGTLKDRQQARQKFREERRDHSELLFSAPEALGLLAQIADALGYLHSENVIHRDIKPANILFRVDGKPVLSDLGIAKSVADNRDLTQTGFAVGTPAYMSPEQRMGAADIDARSDLYSLGVVLYELLTGHKPFRGASGSFEEMQREQQSEVPQLPGEVAHLQPLLNRLLAKNRDERYQTAGELLRAIKSFSGGSESCLSDETVIQRPLHAATDQQRRPRKKWLILAGTSAALLIITVVSISINTFWEPREPVVEPVDNETIRMIEGLKLSAESHTEEGDLISGCPSCAWEVYDRIERLQQGNRDAAAGKQAIRDETLRKIRAEIDQGHSAEAATLIAAAEFYFKDYADTMQELAGLREQAGQ